MFILRERSKDVASFSTSEFDDINDLEWRDMLGWQVVHIE